MRRTAVCDIDLANPWRLVERVGERLLDEALAAVARDMHAACDVVVDTLVGAELAAA